ncbi:protein IMPAIRED IN BABA-INDUCED STERILITY 1-like isoform X2 [Phragmites australis]|uniref:protein IMPAIRED IN BABA-INDUCED STERILITY 1-like isoform X2 n=1 Tax=Phragmites australis TaxID=29695 RepID=UPI002D771745|nr:protein IMPAIRED IN BABA-INDUCED STERILITY 1-like isoform X2 [Phragmites australis]
MGCAASRSGAVASPAYEVSSSSYEVSRSASASVSAELGSASIWSRPVRLEAFELGGADEEERRRPGEARLGGFRRYIEGEQAAAGWPSWLSAVAAEAVQGWVPLKAESFEKLEKIGQGTYSSVFRARELATGRLVALKKVRFDSVEPESVRFMAREILILRRLQRHPNVVGLEGLITSRSSCAIYLVFEYMEHDLAGLNSDPDVAFSEPQIKCYMRQLLEGLAHCHARGVMHRDIKCANLLVSNAGELKVADFGLANLFTPSTAAPLTSRVVTLWYRPPELLLGATAYEPSVDLWSAGCVFGEMHARRPVLQGRTEVEQIHKIFKLCGSPPDDFWRRSGVAHAAVFRPHHPYPSRLRDTFASSMPEPAFRLLATLLSLDPTARGTAATALDSDYFRTPPYACEPSSLPKYAPNKEMDAKFREDSRRRSNGRSHGGDAAKRLSRAHKSMQLPDTNQRHGNGHVHAEESLPGADDNAAARKDGETRLFVDLQPVPTISKQHGDGDDAAPRARTMSSSYKEAPRLAGRLPLSGPVQLAASTGFAWAKKPRPDAAAAAMTKRSSSKGPRTNNNGGGDAARTTTTVPYEVEKQEMIKQWARVAEAFGTSEAYNNRLRQTLDAKQLKTGKKYKGKVDRVDFSGPLLSQPRRIDELLQNHERQIRRAGRRSWFKKGSKREQH